MCFGTTENGDRPEFFPGLTDLLTTPHVYPIFNKVVLPYVFVVLGKRGTQIAPLAAYILGFVFFKDGLTYCAPQTTGRLEKFQSDSQPSGFSAALA